MPGHLVGRTQPFCSCGQQAPRDWPGSAADWRVEHLSEAWPVLVLARDGEPLADWLARVSDEYVVASQAETDAFERAGHHRGLAPGEPIPTIDSDLSAAMSRVMVLQHQLEELSEKVRRRQGLDA